MWVWHDSFIYPPHTLRDSFNPFMTESQRELHSTVDMTHSCVCVTWLIHVCVWHDSFMCVWHDSCIQPPRDSFKRHETWLLTHATWFQRHEPWLQRHKTWLRQMCVTWLLHTQFVNYSYMFHVTGSWDRQHDSKDLSHDSRDTGHDSVMYVWFDLFTYSSWNDYSEHEWNVTRKIWAMTRETRDMTLSYVCDMTCSHTVRASFKHTVSCHWLLRHAT